MLTAALALLIILGTVSPFVLTAGSAAAEVAKTPVMPLGDSITEGQTGHASYRYWLWKNLGTNGYITDFVGSHHGVYGGAPLYTDFDQDNEGHWGWRADEILANIQAWTATNTPQVVLLHIGTNDIFQGQTVDSTAQEIGQIIDKIRINNPNVTVALAKVIPATKNADLLQQLNDKIGTLALQKDTTASHVVAVDQWTGFDATTDTYDGTHPNEVGEKKMATKWYEAIKNFLPAPVASDTVSPTVQIDSPLNNSLVARNANVSISASASDNTAVGIVEISVNGTVQCTVSSAPYTCSFKTSAKRGVIYQIKAKAYDYAGNTAEVISSVTTK